MVDLIKKVEAVLFSVGDYISVEEIAKLTKEKDIDKVQKTLRQLRERLKKSESPIKLHEEGKNWKMNVRDEHMKTIRKVVKKTELPKTLLETLAVIAWKAPVLQSRVIAIRTNKAYDHLDQLQAKGFITRKKHGRTKLINLTSKFNDYFEINKKGGLGKIFKKVSERAKRKYPQSSILKDDSMQEPEPKVEIVDEEQKTEIIEEKDDLVVANEEPKTEVIDEDKTGEKLDNLDVFEEKPSVEVVEEEENQDEIVIGGKKLTEENLEKLKKAQQLLEDEK